MEPAGMSEFSRLTGVFFEPGKAFKDISERPRWLVPLLLIMAASMIYMLVFTQHVGWEQTVRHQIEHSSRAGTMSREQIDQGVATGAKIAAVMAFVGPLIGTPVVYLIEAAVLLGIVAGIMSAPVKFKQVFAVICYAGLPMVVFTGLAIAVMFLKSPDQFNLQNPLVFNAGAFMDQDSSPKFLYSLASSLDLFAIWVVLLIAKGFQCAAGKKLSYGGALAAVAIPWAILVLGKASLAGLFG